MNKGKNKGKDKQKVKDTDPKENVNIDISKELDNYLKIAERELKEKEDVEKIMQQLKNENDAEMDSLKKFKDGANCEELFNYIITLINKNVEIEVESLNLKNENDKLIKVVKSTSEGNLALDKQLYDLESYNKAVLEKIKAMNEEKVQILNDEAIRREDVIKRCDDFKKDVQQKFDVADIETIKKENDNLREKLNEYKEGTKQIQENLEAQLDLKEKTNSEFQENFKTQVQGKLDELLSQSDKFVNENTELKNELKIYQNKYEEMSSTISKFNTTFDSAKKEFEKIMQNILKLTKENRELKPYDMKEIKNQHEIIKQELDVTISANKELQEKIKCLK
jgi:hypothetical protein